jgi:hypothetical protein
MARKRTHFHVIQLFRNDLGIWQTIDWLETKTFAQKVLKEYQMKGRGIYRYIDTRTGAAT